MARDRKRVGSDGGNLEVVTKGHGTVNLTIPQNCVSPSAEVTLTIKPIKDIECIEDASIGKYLECEITTAPERVELKCSAEFKFSIVRDDQNNNSSQRKVIELQQRKQDRISIERNHLDENSTATFQITSFGFFRVLILAPVLNRKTEFKLLSDEIGNMQQTPVVQDVALFKSRNDVRAPSREVFGPITLHDIIKEDVTFSPEYYRALLSQITHAVARLHKIGVEHGELMPQNIYFSEDDKRIVLSETFSADSLMAVERSADIGNLANIFYLVLKKSSSQSVLDPDAFSENDLLCEDPRLAKNLLDKMTDRMNPITAEEILKHPFFWSIHKKLQFFVAVSNKLFKKSTTEGIVKEINDDGKEWSSGWVQRLVIFPEEEEEEKVNTDAMMNHAEAKQKHNKTTVDLLRYIRNYYTHKVEIDEKIGKFIVNNDEELWQFFYRRFPRLFLLIYEKAKETFQNNKDFQGFFCAVHEQDLPDEKTTDSERMEKLYQSFPTSS